MGSTILDLFSVAPMGAAWAAVRNLMCFLFSVVFTDGMS